MKWAATEKVKGTRDYTKGDQIRAKFDSWNIPLSGNTLLWEVDHKATPQWYKNEINSLIDAGEDTEPLSEHVLFHVKDRFSWDSNSEPRTTISRESHLTQTQDTVQHYKGKNTNYKLINEPTHGDDFRSNYKDIWNRVLNLARETDPNAKLGINDYDIARSDMGQCLLDLVDGYEIDWLGVQSQGFYRIRLF